ncbi:MAG: IPExxxVDY family protein [Bacteroidales bacterium]|nr:IPExxxVDY family protein [Bacteroidales bacterium]
MVVKKNKLQVATFDDIHIIGINSTLIDYKLAYYINEKQNFNLVRLDDILLDETLPYAFFYYNAGENCNAYNLVSLKYKDHLCIKLNPHIDYLFIVRNHITPERLALIVKNLRDIKEVNYAYTMELSRTPNIDVLLERIEIHERQSLEKRL